MAAAPAGYCRMCPAFVAPAALWRRRHRAAEEELLLHPRRHLQRRQTAAMAAQRRLDGGSLVGSDMMSDATSVQGALTPPTKHAAKRNGT